MLPNVSKIFLELPKYFKSGKISPNLVTLSETNRKTTNQNLEAMCVLSPQNRLHLHFIEKVWTKAGNENDAACSENIQI